MQRRQAAIPAGEAALARGKSALRSRNYTVAFQEFKTAIAYLPDAVVSGRAHDEAADGVCKSGTVLAEARIAQGDHAGAEAILNEILNRYDPNCRKAQELVAHLRQPGYFNKTVDAGFINKVEEVKRLLARSRRLLSVRPVRQGDETLRPGAGARSVRHRCASEGRNESTTPNINTAKKRTTRRAPGSFGKWRKPGNNRSGKYGAVGPAADNKGRGEVRGTAQMTNKMNSIIIPHIEFRDTTIREAIDFLREQAAENDPSGQGVNIVLRLVPLGQVAGPSAPVLPPPTGAGTSVPGVPAQAPPAGAPAQGAPGGPPGSASAGGDRTGWRAHHGDTG